MLLLARALVAGPAPAGRRGNRPVYGEGVTDSGRAVGGAADGSASHG
jgi:hypothetical protein